VILGVAGSNPVGRPILGLRGEKPRKLPKITDSSLRHGAILGQLLGHSRRNCFNLPRTATPMPIYHELKTDGTSFSYIADAGKIWDGELGRKRRIKKRFPSIKEAEEFLENYKEEPELTGVLYENRVEFLNCYERLNKVNASINDATEYFLKHGAKKENLPINDIIVNLMKLKSTEPLKPRYVNNLKYYLDKFAEYVGGNKKIGDINSELLQKYIHVKNEHCSRITKNNIHVNLSILFNYAVKNNHISVNPLKDIRKIKTGFKKPDILTPNQFSKLLNYCFKNKWHDRLTIFILVGFCGVRREEASKLNWGDVDLKNKRISISDKIAKNWSFREVPISDNAMLWLNKIKDERWVNKKIIGDNWESLLKSAIRNSYVVNKKNAMRHSFGSYSLAAGKKPEVIAQNMGHGTSTHMIASHYRDAGISKELAHDWWSIVPPNTEIKDIPVMKGSSELSSLDVRKLKQFIRHI